MIKQLTLAVAAASALSASVASAEQYGAFDISMNASLTTDYIWRGISQTQGNGAIQGGLDIVHDSGLYAGIWGSNVDFNSDAAVEFDYYAGFGGAITDDIAYDLGYNHYSYPDESGLNFGEYYASVSGWGLTLGANYSDNFAGDDSTLYTYVGYERELPLELTLALQYGNYDFKDATFLSGDDSYNDWSVGLSKAFAGLEFALTYTDTDLSDADCEGFAGDQDFCSANLVLSVSKSL